MNRSYCRRRSYLQMILDALRRRSVTENPAADGKAHDRLIVSTRHLVAGLGQLQQNRKGLTGAHILVVILVLLTVPPGAWAVAADTPKGLQEVALYVTDRGVNQMKDWRTGGNDGVHWTMSDLDPKGRIAVVMPETDDFKSTSTEHLRARIFRDLKSQVDQGLRSGQTRFEIQLVEDITFPGGYFNSNRQELVDRFGAAAYAAIIDLNVYLRSEQVRVKNRAFLGSNATKVFAANIDAWMLNGKSIWDSVDLFDGRAFLTPMVEAIKQIGPSRVRVFNTAGDAWAPFTPWAFRSIANRSTAHLLKDNYFPELQVYELSPQNLSLRPFDLNHISGMLDANRFRVWQYTGSNAGLQPVNGVFTGHDLRNALPKATPRELPKEVEEGIAVWRNAAQDLVDALSTFADNVETRHDSDYLGTPVKGISNGYRLTNALLNDIEKAGEGPIVILTSHTVEELVKVVLEVARDTSLGSNPKLKPHFDRLGAYEEFFSGAMELARTGKVDADTMKSFDKGALELAKRQLTDNNRELRKHRRIIKKLESKVSNISRKLDRAEWDAYGGSRNSHLRRAQDTKLRQLRTSLSNRQAKLAESRAALKQAERRYANRLMLLDAIPELAAAVAEHAREGRLTLNIADRYSDAVIILSASVLALGCERLPVLAPFAPTVRDAIVAGSRFVRDGEMAREAGRIAYTFFSHQKFDLLEQYQTYQARAVHDRQAIKAFSEFFTKEALKKAGFKQHDIDEQDDQARRLNVLLGLETAPVSVEPRSVSDARESDNGTTSADAESERANIPHGPGECSGIDGEVCPPPDNNKRPPCGFPGMLPCHPPGLIVSGGPGEPSSSSPLASPPSPPVPPPTEQPIGGVDPEPQEVRTSGNMPIIEGVVVDPASQRIVLLSEYGSEVDFGVATKDLAFALWLEYTGQNAAFSLDPDDPRNPAGKWLKAVYIPEAIRGTSAGRDLFDADFLLKQYAFGVRLEGNRVVERSTATALKSVSKLMEEAAANTAGETSAQWARFWIVADGVDLQATNGVVRVASVQMGVRARRQVPDPSAATGLRDVDTDNDSIEARFARQFTDLYDELATVESPPLARVRELVSALALAYWMKKQNIPIDLEKVGALLNQDRVEAVDKVTALNVNWRSEKREPVLNGVRTITRNIHIFGGLDLSVKPRVIEDETVAGLRGAVMSKLAHSATFTVAYNGRSYRAFVMPFGVVEH